MMSGNAVLDRREVRPSSASGRGVPVATARVLVIDDERSVADAARLLLSAHGFGVVAVTTPAEALTLAAAQHFDAALVDLNFGQGVTDGQEGLELLSALRAQAPSLPLIVMTAWGSFELAIEALNRGVRDFIEKPWNPSRLISAVRTQIEVGTAFRRLSELEAELRRLRGTSSPAGPAPAPMTDMRLLEVEAMLVKQAMEKYDGNISKAARALGLSRSALYRRLERHNIQ
jgi:DNA-binding NtrC family response regulator